MHTQYLSIDIGGSSIKYALLDGAGNLTSRAKIPRPKSLDEFRHWLNYLIEKYHGHIRGIGVCCPGKVNPTTTLISNGGAAPYLDGVVFTDLIEDKALPVAIENDAKAATLAELWMGQLRHIENGAALILGTSIGGGIVLGGQLVLGDHLQAGEIGYMITRPDAPTGREMVAGFNTSAVAMIKQINELANNSDLPNGYAAFDTIRKDSNARKIFDDYCAKVAQVLINLNSVIDVPQIVIGGGISSQPLVVQEISHQYDAFAEKISVIKRRLTKPNIVAAKFLSEANLYGAVYNLLLSLDDKPQV